MLSVPALGSFCTWAASSEPGQAVLPTAGAAVALYLPWVLYPRFIAPPGDRLLGDAAGICEPDRKSFLSDLIRRYADRSVLSVFANKLFTSKTSSPPWRWWRWVHR